MKMQTKVGGGPGVGWGGQGGCEQRIEFNVHYVNIPICFIPQVSPFYIVEKVK